MILSDLRWRTSSRSGVNNNCVEVGSTNGAVEVGDGVDRPITRPDALIQERFDFVGRDVRPGGEDAVARDLLHHLARRAVAHGDEDAALTARQTAGEHLGVDARERDVAGADLQRDQVVEERCAHRHHEQEHHRDPVHREDLVVLVGVQQRAVGAGELRADQQGLDAADHEEHEGGNHEALAEDRMVDRRETAPATRRIPDARQFLRAGALFRCPTISPSGAACICAARPSPPCPRKSS